MCNIIQDNSILCKKNQTIGEAMQRIQKVPCKIQEQPWTNFKYLLVNLKRNLKKSFRQQRKLTTISNHVVNTIKETQRNGRYAKKTVLFFRGSSYLQSKYTESKHEQNMAMVQMQREIDILRATEESFRKKVLELELDNDDLERTER